MEIRITTLTVNVAINWWNQWLLGWLRKKFYFLTTYKNCISNKICCEIFHMCILCILILFIPPIAFFYTLPNYLFSNFNHFPFTFTRLLSLKITSKIPIWKQKLSLYFWVFFFHFFSINMNLITITTFLRMTWFFSSLCLTKIVLYICTTFSLSTHPLLSTMPFCHSATVKSATILRRQEQNTVFNYMHGRKLKSL